MLCTKSHHTEIDGTLQDDAEWIYYGFICGKFTKNEFLIHVRNLRKRDTEAYEYLIWLSRRHKWVFVQGDVLKEGVEKWKRPHMYKMKNYLKQIL